MVSLGRFATQPFILKQAQPRSHAINYEAPGGVFGCLESQHNRPNKPNRPRTFLLLGACANRRWALLSFLMPSIHLPVFIRGRVVPNANEPEVVLGEALLPVNIL